VTRAGAGARRPGPGVAPAALRLVVGLALLGLGGCAAVAGAPWPPAAGEPRHRIIISVDTWHAMIALPGPEPGRFEEWGYAERGWYLEGRQGLTGAIRAMLWPSAGVIEVARTERLWAERTPDPPAETFALEVGADGLARLREHLRSTIAGPEPVAEVGQSRFFAARRSYHLFHQCHQYAAHALRAAGLPVTPASAFTRALFAAQLRQLAAASTVEAEPARPPR